MQIKLNIQKKHFWIITSLIIMMIGALVLAAPISKINMNSADEFGHNTEDLNFKIYQEIYEKSDGNTEIGKEVGCPENHLAISCSVYSKCTDCGDEDSWFCKVREDQGGCMFSYDVAGTLDYNPTEYICYCIASQK